MAAFPAIPVAVGEAEYTQASICSFTLAASWARL